MVPAHAQDKPDDKKPQAGAQAVCHGVQVYPGARQDAEQTKFLRELAGADGCCFRTQDSLKKVAAFYQAQSGLTSMGVDETMGMFVKEGDGRTVYVKIASPWQPAKGGELQKDTSIVITRE